MKTFIVDAFTSERFRGNPAGVCLVESAIADQTMLDIARELNLSETAFVTRDGVGGRYDIRFFSPKMEIPLCGHATLAAAKILHADASSPKVNFVTKHGVRIPARVDGEKIRIAMPVYEVVAATVPEKLLQALGLNAIIDARFNLDLGILLLEVADPVVLAALQPDFRCLETSHQGINGVVVTARATDPLVDFTYRYFWPWSGSDEDPVTGGVQTFLGPYWSRKLGRLRLNAFQASARTGVMDIEVSPDKVIISADAVIVFEGRMMASNEAHCPLRQERTQQ